MQCSLHGLQEIGLLCTHLAHSLLDQTTVGFHQYDPTDLATLEAWCDTCESRWQQTKNIQQQDQWLLDCDFKVLCATCWQEAKELND